MEENKITIGLKMVIILIILCFIVVGILFAAMTYLYKSNNGGLDVDVSQDSRDMPIQDSKETPNIEADEDFTFDFLKMENNKENMIYSPLSIKYALNMLNEGANGNTKTQIEKVIGNLSLTKYNNIDNVLSLANGVYIRDTYAKYVKEDYNNILTKKYNAETKYDDFNSANSINKWIEDKTLGIIKNMLKDEMVQNTNNEMFLINALAIDMEWKECFDSSKTYGEDFNLANGSKIKATTMNKETSSDGIAYYKDKDITALTMDLQKYDDTQLEFIAIMPESNLENYIKDLKTEDIDNIIKKSTLASKTKYGLDISIPRFSFDYSLKLKKDLMSLGITEAFDDVLADFSDMTNNPDGLYVSDALHKANIDFTEKGVKAAAATVIIMTDKAMIIDKNRPEEIKIDKPFLYVIRDKNTGEIWFVGSVYEPNSWEDDKEEYQYR